MSRVSIRVCSRVACVVEAVATLTYDYAESIAVLGPLGFTLEPHCYDLCPKHSGRLTVPLGWTIVRHSSVEHLNFAP